MPAVWVGWLLWVSSLTFCSEQACSPAPAQAGHGFVPPSLGRELWNLLTVESTEECCPKGKGPALFV